MRGMSFFLRTLLIVISVSWLSSQKTTTDGNLTQIQTTTSSEAPQLKNDPLNNEGNATITDETTNLGKSRPGLHGTIEDFPMRNSTLGLELEKSEGSLSIPTDETTASIANEWFTEGIITDLNNNNDISSNEIDSLTTTALETTCLNFSHLIGDKERNISDQTSDTNRSEEIKGMCQDKGIHNTTGNHTQFVENPTENESQQFGSIMVAIVGFLVMVMNGVVLVTCLDERLRQNTYLNLVLGLSVNDFLLGLSTFIGGLRLIFGWLNSLGLCIVITVMAASCLIISLYQTFCISLHRYLVISKNEWSEILFKGKRTYFLCLTGWVAIVGSFASLVSPTGYKNNLCFHAVVYKGTIVETRWFYTIIMTSLMFTTVFFYCFAIYSLKVRYLGMSEEFLKSTNTQHSKKSTNTRRRIINSMKMVSFLLFALFVFSGPLAVLNTLDLPHDENKELFFIAFAFAVLNSLINPFIYYFNIEEFQEALKKLFCTAPR